jgi:hypothetical protein
LLSSGERSFVVTLRIAIALTVTFLPACGVGARSGAAPEPNHAVGFETTADHLLPDDRKAERSDTADDYVVGPFEQGGIRTYYLVRR